jgi:hypothetical protein
MKGRYEARLRAKCSQDGPDLVAIHVFNGIVRVVAYL